MPCEELRNVVVGLPDDVLERDGNTIVLLKQLQAKGLNRDVKRSLSEPPKGASCFDAIITKCLGDSIAHLAEKDKQLIRRWSNPTARMGYFWGARQAGPAGRDRRTAIDYAYSVDLFFLDEFDNDWIKLSFDEELLLASCTAWPEIRAGVEKHLALLSTKPSLNVFMLWPKIVDELAHWPERDEARQRAVSHAVFALCSASGNAWFARRAVELCSDFRPSYAAAEPEEFGRSTSTQELTPAGFQADWEALLERLDGLRDELRSRPSRQSVADLVSLGEEFGLMAEHLPAAEESLREAIKANVGALIALCREWSGKSEEFAWLDVTMLRALEKRWEEALGEPPEADLEALSTDADAARGRTALAGIAFESEAGERQALQDKLDTLGRQLQAAKSSIERKPIERKRRQRERALLDLEERLESLQDAFLAAASPYCRLFETEADDSREVEPETSALGMDAPSMEPTLAVDPAQPDAVLPLSVAESVQEAAAEAEILPAPAPEPDAVSELASDLMPESATTALAEHAIPAREESSPCFPIAGGAAERTREEIYSPVAGNACGPIWALLARGNLSLACQFARAMGTEDDRIRTPPLDLLEAVALAHSLVFPDGGLRESVAARLQNFSEKWFHEDSPQTWHTALNLLLVAATLRPMVLCPESGASAIAGYLHLESQGRYKSLYSLVQSLRESSDRLLGFRIELASIRHARSEAAIDNDFSVLQAEAGDWLRIQAPAMTIKFAAATKVWHAWLKPDGLIARLVSPVASNRTSELAEVRDLIRLLSDHSELRKLIRKTDRTENQRLRGEDIHSGALDHLARCTREAIGLARRWVALRESQSPSNDQMRKLLMNIREKLEQSREPIRAELTGTDSDSWGLVASSQKTALRELQALQALFDPESPPLPASEPPADEALGRDMLYVPSIRIGADWSIETPADELLLSIRQWLAEPVLFMDAFDARLERGDVFGARLLLMCAGDEHSTLDLEDSLRREHDSWRAKLKSALQEARRNIEIGSAYGYISDPERGVWESDLVVVEAQTAEHGHFDLALRSIVDISAFIRRNRDDRAGEVYGAITELARSGRSAADLAEVERVVSEGDIATANELLQRVRNGLSPWPEDLLIADPFRSFVSCIPALEDWLSSRKAREPVDLTIRKREAIPGLELGKVDGAQLDQAAKMFADWSMLKSRREPDAVKLQSFFSGIGFVLPKPPSREDKTQGMEVWKMTSMTVEDRAVCPIPHFGSGAKGNYRVICRWERPTEDDIVQMIGDSSLHRATIVLYFGRMSERKWRDISRKTKVAHKSFVLVDEVMLLFLAGQSGSRLAAFFSTALPFAYSDPYDATAGLVPPEMFFGRTAELNAIHGVNGRCFIYGGRQLGKTALMRRAEQAFHAPEKRRYSTWIDLRAEGIGVNREASELWLPLAARLKEAGVLGGAFGFASLAKRGGVGVDALLQEVRRFLDEDAERRILLLLDEADRFFEQDGRHDFAETRRLKQLMDVTQRRFKVVFAGLHNVLRMTERANHPLAHFGEPIKIGPFIDEHEIREAQDLVRKPLLAAGFEFDAPSLVIRILAQTNYYPSLIQLYCHHLLRHMLAKVGTAQRPPGPRYRITNQDIEAVYSSGDLRDEIRNKFRLTLQLDLRYEVVAYAMALESLAGRCPHNEGMDWRSIWQRGAMQWWPEGFHDTSELDFRVLLDEMVELGVLSRNLERRYSLRNPNIFLLLGNQEEIETVLVKSRQPTGEFDSAAFRAHLRDQPNSPHRNPLTYQQLSELLSQENSILALAGSVAAGSDGLVPALKDYLALTSSGTLVEIGGCGDHVAFASALENITKKKQYDGLTLVVVPDTVPWSGIWVRDAKRLLARLRSPSRFVSVVFVADPVMMWGALGDEVLRELEIPWMSMLPWRESFVRQWLEDLKLPNVSERLGAATGFWPSLLYSMVEKRSIGNEFERRIDAAVHRWTDPQEVSKYLAEFGLNLHLPQQILGILAEWGPPAEPSELAELSECSRDVVDRALRWGELLGLARREGGDLWTLDPIVKQVLQAART